MNMIESFISQNSDLILKRIKELIGNHDQLHSELFEAALYSVDAPAKRLRPILTLATIATFEKEIEKGLDTACAIELIHTYSLIHDDLPCMDDDDFRRGKPSLHKQYSEALAVLTGDYLLTYSFEIISKIKGLRDDQIIKLIQILSKHSGAFGMIGGQVVDMAYQGKTIDRTILEFMHSYKTASLIIASIECGAVIADVDKEVFNHLSLFGKYIGVAFQMVDDILDVSDLEKNKANAVTLLGLKGAKDLAKDLYEKALTFLPKKDHLLHNLAEKMMQRAF